MPNIRTERGSKISLSPFGKLNCEMGTLRGGSRRYEQNEMVGGNLTICWLDTTSQARRSSIFVLITVTSTGLSTFYIGSIMI
jgi:hypothetical protein